MRAILMLGHFGGNKQILDGQTIKTRILYDELKKTTDWKIRTVDTYYKDKMPICLLLKSIYSLTITKDVIVLLSGRGMRFYFPLLYFYAKAFHKRIYHDLIGGNLDIYIKKYPQFKKYLNSFVVNWSETSYVKAKMEEFGITNFEMLANFKRLNCIGQNELTCTCAVPYKLCTFSRVMKEKGIEDAINAVKKVNEMFGRTMFTLDIYGQVDAEQHDWFNQVQKSLPDFIHYGGEISYENSTNVLKGYYALVFPTLFYMEGIPGTIIDAYAAGVPVISSKWRSFDDVVYEGITGIGYEFGNLEMLVGLLKEIIANPDKLSGMKQACLKEAQWYLPENNINIIIEKIKN